MFNNILWQQQMSTIWMCTAEGVGEAVGLRLRLAMVVVLKLSFEQITLVILTKHNSK